MSLTPTELELLRDEATVWQSDLCDIYRMTDADDEFGGSGDETEEKVYSDVPCMISTGAGHEQLLTLFGFAREMTLFIVDLQAETDVRLKDHLIVTTKDNEHMMVQAVMEPETDEIERRVVANSLAEHNV